MLALPPLPPVTVYETAIYETIIVQIGKEKEGIPRVEKTLIIRENYITYLIQAHLFAELANDEFIDDKSDSNYIIQAWKNYEAYLKYNK